MSEKNVLDFLEDFVTRAVPDVHGTLLSREQASELLTGITGLTDLLSDVTRSSREARVAAQLNIDRKAAIIQQQEFALVQSELERDQLLLLNRRQAALIRELREEIELSATEIDGLYAELEEAADESEPDVIVEHGDSSPVPGGARDDDAVSVEASGSCYYGHCECYLDGGECCDCGASPDPQAA